MAASTRVLSAAKSDADAAPVVLSSAGRTARSGSEPRWWWPASTFFDGREEHRRDDRPDTMVKPPSSITAAWPEVMPLSSVRAQPVDVARQQNAQRARGADDGEGWAGL